MHNYLIITVKSNPGEAEAAFKSRLAAFWTHMLRNKPDDYEKVYAEATAFETNGDCVTRQYMIEADVLGVLQSELTTHHIAHDNVDEDDLYSKYEAAPPDWFWLEH